ncbi:TPA: hypothetical protein N0F65_007549 [Lagenidium giganteum]|uniref:Uncharacterized protein n=1 Tax=Lagenidium giganteum TaxID=4803 RepID=A0AAV2ZLL5_9STRA|nr:TPA: hypothetical protein N0F65_007549 [Lagenidium giganteum]
MKKVAAALGFVLAFIWAINSAPLVHAAFANETKGTDEMQSIRFTRLVEPNAGCGSRNGRIAMCATKNYMCRMPSNQMAAARTPKCMPMNEAATDAATRYALDSAAPWAACNPAEVDVNRPLCRFHFTCQCKDPMNGSDCVCMPPDTVKAFVQDISAPCGDHGTCAPNKYCQWVQGKGGNFQYCGLRPYFQPLKQ